MHSGRFDMPRTAPIVAALFALLASFAGAADYPTRPVTMVLGFAPAGPSDVVARLVARKLRANHRPAGRGRETVPERAGNVAGEMVARAAPDGHNRCSLGTNGILATNISLYKKIGFDPAKDFAPITLVGAQGPT